MSAGVDDLQHFLEQCCMEYLAQVNGPGEWVVYGLTGPVGDDRRYDIDNDITEGPIVMVRRSDKQRVAVDVSVTAWEVPSG